MSSNSIELTDSPDVVRLKKEFRQLDQQYERVRSLDADVEIENPVLAQLRLAKRQIAQFPPATVRPVNQVDVTVIGHRYDSQRQAAAASRNFSDLQSPSVSN